MLLESIVVTETLFGSILIAIMVYIFVGSAKMYRISRYRPIAVFAQSFLFFILAFLLRYVNKLLSVYLTDKAYALVEIFTHIIIGYFFAVAGFLLVYSMVYKEVGSGKNYYLHGLAMLVGIVDGLTLTYLGYVTQFLVIGYGIYTIGLRYKENKKLSNYLLALILSLLGYGMFFLSEFIVPLYPLFILYTYTLTIGIFLIFAYGVATLGKKA